MAGPDDRGASYPRQVGLPSPLVPSREAPLGVRPQHRRRGIATALLNRSFAEFQKRGYERVGLGVDSDNQSGATGAYERVGMRRERHYDFYRKELTQSQSPH